MSKVLKAKEHPQNPAHLLAFREKYDLSQRELGLLLGRTGACISQWENEKRYLPIVIARLMLALRTCRNFRRTVFLAEKLGHKLTNV